MGVPVLIDLQKIGSYLDTRGGKVTLGLDGFVDEVWQVLAKRNSQTDYVLYERMRDFAKAVYDVGTGGMANEIIRKRRSFGGCVGNTSSAIGRLGGNPTMVGMFGKAAVDPVFVPFQEKYKLISLADPAICVIFEFTDGKLMLPYSGETADYRWEDLTNAMSNEELALAFDADIVSFGYWSQLNYFDELISGLCENFLFNSRCRRLFFDFADIRKRDKQALLATLERLAELNKNIPMTLSLNEHEAGLLYSYVGKSFDWTKPESAEDDIDYVRTKAGLDEIIIHTPYFAVGTSASEGRAMVVHEHCKDPVITTGAGDNFNGGYLLASMDAGKLNFAERLAVGNATTGFYIRNGFSPDKEDVKGELARVYNKRMN